jgi:acyl-CoA thioesterase
MTQRGRPILEAFAWFIGEVEGLTHDAARMPLVPGPEGLPSMEDLLPPEERAPYPFWENLEVRPTRFVPPKLRRADAPVLQSWYRFRPRATFTDPVLDAARMLVLVDTMQWPAAFRAHDDPPYVAPNIDLAVQLHRLAPDVEWLLCDAISPVAADGLVGGRAAVWSAGGVLLASGASQLLCRPAPAAP